MEYITRTKIQRKYMVMTTKTLIAYEKGFHIKEIKLNMIQEIKKKTRLSMDVYSNSHYENDIGMIH